VQVSSRTGIERRSHEQAIDICRLLEHGYQDDGGRTILRELFQNADDAEATVLSIILLDRIPEARHVLLQGPVLLVTNDGALKASDAEALRGAAGGNKGEDETKIGRFGLGLKSVFRLCEAFLYAGSDGTDAEPMCGVVNPHAGSSLFPQWDLRNEEDGIALLAAATDALRDLGSAPTNGLLAIALPLRKKSHHHGDLCLSSWNPGDALEEICRQLSSSAPAVALLLPQAGFLRRVHIANRIGGRDDVIADTSLISDGSPGVSLGRYVQAQDADRPIAGIVKAHNGQEWRVRSRELAGDSAELAALRVAGQANWPNDFRRQDDGGFTKRPRKAVAHGAVTVIHAEGHVGRPGKVAVRWATFLPLDDGPVPNSQVARYRDLEAGAPSLDVLLHGYFWPSEERKRLFGVTEPKRDVQDPTLQLADTWNMSLARSHVLPLLPEVLADALPLVPEVHRWAVVSAVASTLPVPDHVQVASRLTQRASLLPLLTRSGVAWTAIPAERLGRVRAAANWSSAPQWAKTALSEAAEKAGFDLADAALQVKPLGRIGNQWSGEEVDALLGALETERWPRDALDARWMVTQLGALLEEAPSAARSMSTIVRRIQGSGLGPNGHRVTGERDHRLALRDAWEPLLNGIGRHMVVKAVSATARRAVAWLSEREATTAPYLLAPGLSVHTPRRLSSQDNVGALGLIGTELGVVTAVPGQVKEHIESLFALARDLVVELGVSALGAHATLRMLPLLRAWRAQTEDWYPASMATLEQKARDCQLFVCDVVQPSDSESDADENADERALVQAPRKEQMARWTAAMDCDAWLVHPRLRLDGNDGAGAPRVAPLVLAEAVLANVSSVRSGAENRTGLAHELVSANIDTDDRLRAALRLLVHGDGGHVDDLDAQLWFPAAEPGLPDFMLAVEAVLRVQSLSWSLVDAVWHRLLTGAVISQIGLRRIEAIAPLLPREPFEWPLLAPEEREAILAASASNASIFTALPLHERASGELGPLTKSLYLPDLEVPNTEDIVSRVELLRLPLPTRLRAPYEALVPRFGHRELVTVILQTPHPVAHFATLTEALHALGSLGSLSPGLYDQRDELALAHWIPLAGTGRGIAPCDVLFASDAAAPQLRTLLRDLGTTEAFSLWSDVDGGARGRCAGLVRALQEDAAWPAALVKHLKKGAVPMAWRVAPQARMLTDTLLAQLLESRKLVTGHPGWKLLSMAHEELSNGNDGQATAQERISPTLIGLAAALTGEFNDPAWRAMLEPLAEKTVGETHPWLAVLRWRLTVELALPRDKFSGLRVPTAGNSWRPADKVAVSVAGVPQDQRLHDLVRALLGLDREERESPRPATVEPEYSTRLSDTELLEFLRTRTEPEPPHVVGALLALHGGACAEFVAADLLNGPSVESVRRSLQAVAPASDAFETEFRQTTAAPGTAWVDSLAGPKFMVELGASTQSLLAEDPILVRALTGQHMVRVVLRDVKFSKLTDEQRAAALEEWAFALNRRVLRVSDQHFSAWWGKLTETTQAGVEPLRNELIDMLPSCLELFDLRTPELRVVKQQLVQAQRAEREENEVARREARTDRIWRLKQASLEKRQELAVTVSTGRARTAMLQAVRSYMRKQGYTAASVPLELFQNADDALVQLSQMSKNVLPYDVCKVEFRLLPAAETKVSPTIQMIHWGRPVNEHGGSRFALGKERGWDRDLYNMLRFQVSAKDGDNSNGKSVTTGRFGLGFKSVHFVTESPQVVSRGVAFAVDAGLLPTGIEYKTDVEPIGEMYPTIISLPLDIEVEPDELVELMFSRIRVAAPFLPAMARRVTELILPDGPSRSVRHAFAADDIDGAPGWTLSREVVEVGAAPARACRLLRWRPSDPGTATTLLLALDGAGNTVPVGDDLDSGPATLWTAAPTMEHWGLGYMVGGDFKLDTGRSNVDTRAEETRSFLSTMGEELGGALVSLVEVLLASGDGRLNWTGNPHRTLGSIWLQLGRAIPDLPDDCRACVLDLHGNGNGLGRLTSSLQCVPSGLPMPFRQLVGPFVPLSKVSEASSQLAGVASRLVERIPDLGNAGQSATLVSGEVAAILRYILGIKTPRQTAVDLLSSWTERVRHQIDPALAQNFAVLADKEVWSALRSEDETRFAAWRSSTRWRAADGNWRAANDLVVPLATTPTDEAIKDKKDELRRVGLAPASERLADEYAKVPSALGTFVLMREQLANAGAPVLAGWARQAKTAETQVAAVKYLLEGELAGQMAFLIRAGESLDWIRADNCNAWATKAGYLEAVDAQRLHLALFGALIIPMAEPEDDDGEDVDEVPDNSTEDALSAEDATRRLTDLYADWGNESYRKAKLSALRKEFWPSDLWSEVETENALRQQDHDRHREAWITLLLLGTVQRLGFQAAAHAGYIRHLHGHSIGGRSKWQWLFGDEAPERTWLEFFDQWSHSRTDLIPPKGNFDYWLSVLPEMYAVVRYWKTYARLLTGAGAARKLTSGALAPSSWEELSGTGIEAPALPALRNRFEWIRQELVHFKVVREDNRPSSTSESALGYEPSLDLARVLGRLGMPDVADEQGMPDFEASDAFDFIARMLGSREMARFHGYGDLPLRLERHRFFDD
jgi:hypothetical protein